MAQYEPDPPSKHNPAAAGDLEIICLKCLAKDASRRYGSAEDLANDVDRWLAGEPIEARDFGTVERMVKWIKGRPTEAALTGLSVLVVALVLGFVIWQWRVAISEQTAVQERKKLARVKDAALLTHMVTESQQLYSDVVDRVKHKVEVSHEYTMKEGTIPLPPTLTMILADKISKKNLGTVKLYSDKPFPSRKTPARTG